MTDYETMLLRRFARISDAEAFAEITRLYAGMVYGVCLRVTGDPARAADAAQETFFYFARNARRVSGSLSGWLHRVAVGKSVDLVRSDIARRRREQEYATQPRETDQWSDVSPLVDEALLEVDEPERELLMRHFLQGGTLTAIAAEMGVSQPTVSRRMDAAVEQLRARLRAKGVAVSVAALGTLLGGTACSATPALLAELGRMAMVSSGASAVARVVTTTGAGVKVAAAVTALAASVGGWLVYQASRLENAPPVQPAPRAHPLSVATTKSETTSATLPSPLAPVPMAPAKSALSTPAPVASTPSAEVGQARGGFAGDTIRGTWSPIGGGGRMGMARGSAMDSNRGTPAGALNFFVVALGTAARRPERLADCFVVGSPEFRRFQRIIQSPQTDEERSFQQCLLALIPPAEVIEASPEEEALRVKWRARLSQEITMNKKGQPRSWQRGDYIELEVLLKQVGTEWRILGFRDGRTSDDPGNQAVNIQIRSTACFDPARDFNIVRLEENQAESTPRAIVRWLRVMDNVTFQSMSNTWVPMSWRYICSSYSVRDSNDTTASTAHIRRIVFQPSPDHDKIGSFKAPGHVRDGWTVRMHGFGGQFAGFTRLRWKSGRVVDATDRAVFDPAHPPNRPQGAK